MELSWLLPVAFLLLFVFKGKIMGAMSGFQEIGPAEAARLVEEGAILLDVRERTEWARGHIPGARHLPLGQLGARLPELENLRTKPVVVQCQSGTRSAMAARMLKQAGFEHVYNLGGGLMAWTMAGRKTER